MKYWVTVGAETIEVSIDGEHVVVNGRACDAAVDALSGSAFVKLTLDGVQSRFGVVRVEDGWVVSGAGETAVAQVETERTRRLAKARVGKGGGRGSGMVRAPMPGLVLRVEVAVGDHVSAGDGLLVLEAMKMENVIKAAVGGRVRQVHVSRGAAVEKATLLVDIDEAS